MIRWFVIVCAVFLITQPAYAVMDEAEIEVDETERDIASYIPDFVQVPKGGLSWDIFTKTKEIMVSGKDEQGMDYEFKMPEFSDDMRKLNGQTILMQGYMFPLEADEKQGTFLFGPFPVSCPFHYHVGPALMIEVKAKKPIKFSYEPINIKGRLELIPKDMDTEVFYRLHDAVIEN